MRKIIALAMLALPALAIDFGGTATTPLQVNNATNAVMSQVYNDTLIPQSVNTAVWGTVNDWVQGAGSPGMIHGGELSYNTNNNSVTVSNGFGIFQEQTRDFTTSGVKVIKWFSWTNSTFTLPLGTNQYIYIMEDAPGGSPYLIMENVSELSTYYKWQLYRVTINNSGKSPYVLETMPQLSSYAIRDNDRLIDQRNVTMGTGLGVSFATNFFHGEAGNVWMGCNKILEDAWYSDAPGLSNNYYIYYCTNAGLNAWVELSTNRLDVHHYNSNSFSLATATNGAWLSYWLYWSAKKQPTFIYGSQYNSKAEAYNDAIPTVLPYHFANFCSLVCQVITTQNCPNVIELRKNGTFVSGTAAVSDHDALSNRDRVGNHSAYLDLGGTRPMTGDINLGNHNISNVYSVTIGNDSQSNSFLFIMQAPVIGGHGCCAYMSGTNPPSPAGAAIGPCYTGRRARGNDTSPLVVQADDILVLLAGRGWDGSAWGTLSDAQITECASETFTPTAHGTYISFKTTPKGTVARTTQVTINDNCLTAITGHRSSTGNYSNDEWMALSDVQGYTNYALVDAQTRIGTATNSALNAAQVFSDTKTNGLATQVQQWTNAVLVAAYAKDDSYSNTLMSTIYNPGFAEIGRTNGPGIVVTVPASGWWTLTNWNYVVTNIFDMTPSNITIRAMSGTPTTMFVRISAFTHWSPAANGKGVQMAIFKNNVQKLGVDGIVEDNNANASTIVPESVTIFDSANAGDVYDVRVQQISGTTTLTEYGGSFCVDRK